jgi:pectinesterase
LKGAIVMVERFLTPADDIQAVLDSLPADMPATLRLAAGTYHQKLHIRHGGLSLLGAGRDATVIAFDDYNFRVHRDGREFNTFRTPTVTVVADGVTFSDVTIANTAGSGPGIGQAVALAVYGTDFAMTDGCLKGHQDTLFCGPLPYDLTLRYRDFLPDEELHVRPSLQTYANCRIEGTVDFIFGSATALFRECEIVVLGRGYVAAPSTYADVPYGLVFQRCAIQNVSDTDDVYLGRPWRESGSAIFLDCRFEGRFRAERFHDWEKPRHRFMEKPYVPAALSRALGQEETERLETFLAERFQPPRTKMA